MEKEILPLHSSVEPYIDRMTCDFIGSSQPMVKYAQVNENLLYVKLSFQLNEIVRQDDWRLEITPSFRPSFHWAPHLTPTDEHIIDQHSFRSPALVVQDDQRTVALVPDLDLLSGEIPVRWYMDLNARDNKLCLGMSEYAVKEHVLYIRELGAQYPAGTVEIGFYLFLFDDADTLRNPWRPVLDFLWRRWGGPLFQQGEPLRRSLMPYVRHTYQWVFEKWEKNVWQQFELDGIMVGAPVFIVNVTQSPNYPGDVNEREVRSIWNQAWFSSLRSAQGLYRYGKETGNPDLVRRALMTKELALSAPQNDGFFPSVIATEMETIEENGHMLNRSLGWDTRYWGNSNRNPFSGGSIKAAPYHILDMSWTALLMLRWHDELEMDERLLAYASCYAEALLKLQDEQGYFPAWLDKETRRPLGVLDQSPETSQSVTFLLKLHGLTKNPTFLAAARRAMDAVVREIVPAGRWEDFETYWSCSPYGQDNLVSGKVARNNMYKQCNFSIYWTAEALLALYRETGEQSYLDVGERCLDELLMTQASWQPPYMYVNTLGGFGVMNSDGEWNDSRQSLFSELILQYGLELDRKEYVERALAALCCSFVMMYCPENERTKKQWERAFPFFNEKDYGYMMENYGHGGKVDDNGLGIGEFTIYDWGNGAAAECFMRMKSRYAELLGRYSLL